MPTDGARRSRRALLASAAGGAAALAAAQLARPATALAVAVPVNLDMDNPSTLLTSITQTTADTPAFAATGNGKGSGVQGTSTSGPGVLGTTGQLTMSGIVGLAGDTTGSWYEHVLASDPPGAALEAGVYGWSAPATPDDWSAGVYGEANDYGSGVYGEGGWGVEGWGGTGVFGGGFMGVHGHGGEGLPWPSVPTKITGVLASCDSGGVALDVRGKTKFDKYTASRALIAKGKSSVKVTLAGVTSSSLIFAALKTYRAGYYVAAVVPTTGAFTIYLNKALTSATYLSYFVVN